MFMTGDRHVSDLLSSLPSFFFWEGSTSNNNNIEKKNKNNRKEALLCVICQSSVPFFPISNRDSFDIKEEKDHSTLSCKYQKSVFFFFRLNPRRMEGKKMDIIYPRN